MRVAARSGLAGRFAWVFVAGCLVFSIAAGFRHVRGAVPYPEHIDEGYLVTPAANVLQSESRDPKSYSYPSLPIYLDAMALAVGLIKASGEGPKPIKVRELGNLEPPVYDHPQVHLVPRQLWVLIGALTLAAAAAVASQLVGAFGTFFTASVLTLVAAPTALAWTYLGVDVPMTLFAMLALYGACSDRENDGARHRVAEPAILCGAAMACKFTAFLVLVPCVLAIWLFGKRRRLSRSVTLMVLSVLVFCVLCPRFLIDLDKFIDGIAFENFHYRVRGHAGHDVEPGWPQLAAYVEDIRGTYGPVIAFMAVLGIPTLFKRDPRGACVLTSFAAIWMLFLCSYKVHFPRNLLPVLLLVPVYASAAFVAVWLGALALYKRFARSRERAPLWAAITVAVFALVAVPYQTVRDRYAHAYQVDSRNRFARWAAHHLADGSEVLVPTSLAVSAETLPEHIKPSFVDLTSADAVRELAQPGRYILIPEWRAAGGGKKAARIATQAPGTAAIPDHEIVKDFPGEPGLPMQPKRILRNPSFMLARIR